MKVTRIDVLSDDRWDDFVTRHPESTIFHHSAWARVLQDRYRCSPVYYALESEQGELSAVAPFFRIQNPLIGKRLVCLPCSEYCFPLAYTCEDIAQLLVAPKEEVNGSRFSHLEVRGWSDLGIPGETGMKENAYYLTHVAGLDTDPERLMARLDHDARYNIRRAEKSQLTIREAQGENDLKKFHLLTTVTRRRLNLLPWPYQFFQSIYRHIVSSGYGFLLLAELEERLVAGSMYFSFKDTVTQKFNASDKNYTQYKPNYLIIWEAIKRAHREGYRRFDLGITNPENQGLATFKRHWGADEAVFPYYYYPAVSGVSSSPQTSFIYRAYTAANKRMPNFALKLAANALYRHLG